MAIVVIETGSEVGEFGTTHYFKLEVDGVIATRTKQDDSVVDRIFGVEVQPGFTLEYQMEKFLENYNGI